MVKNDDINFDILLSGAHGIIAPLKKTLQIPKTKPDEPTLCAFLLNRLYSLLNPILLIHKTANLLSPF